MNSRHLDHDQLRHLGYSIVDMIVDHRRDLSTMRVSNVSTRPELESRLAEPLPEEASGVDEVLATLRDDVLANVSHADHPRFFAYVPAPGDGIGAMADALAAGLNIFAGAWAMASGPAEVELVAIEWLRQICGLPEGAGGLFVSGGSMANLTALAVARQVMGRENDRGTCLYFSDQTHSSIERGARMLGFDVALLRRIPCDASQRLDLDALRRSIVADRENGLHPFCVVANAGTTSSGAVDPIEEMAALCRGEDLWLHVDGAYGAPAIMTERGRALLQGIGLADSISLDPHKWFFQPFECGSLLVRRGEWLRDTFRMVPAYLRDSDWSVEEVNFRDCGVQLTRGFRALKFWMSMKLRGAAYYRRAIEHGMKMAEHAEQRLRERGGWRIVTPAQLAIVTFAREPHATTDVEELDRLHSDIAARLFDDGFAMSSTTAIDGRTVLRLCTINPRTTEQDIDETIDLIDRFARESIDRAPSPAL